MVIIAALCLAPGCDHGSSGGRDSGTSSSGSSSSSTGSSGGCDTGSSSSSGADPVDLHLAGNVFDLNADDLATTIYLRDSAGNHRTARSNADGAFVFDETGMVPPYLLIFRIAAPAGYADRGINLFYLTEDGLDLLSGGSPHRPG